MIDMAHESHANTRWLRIARIAASALASAFAGSSARSTVADFQNLLDNLLPCPLDTEGENCHRNQARRWPGLCLYKSPLPPGSKAFRQMWVFSCNCLRSSDRQSGW